MLIPKYPRSMGRSKRGASLVEYGILAGLISTGGIVAVMTTGEEISSFFSSTADVIADIKNGGAGGGEGESLPPSPMVLTFNTNNAGNSHVTLPLFGAVNATIDWGGANSGCPTSVTSVGEVTCVYDAPGVYTVSISGLVAQYGNSSNFDVPNVDNLVSVDDWGNVGLVSLDQAFGKADYLASLPNDFPSSVTDMTRMFYDMDGNPTIGSNWDLANVTTMYETFRNTSNFSRDISGWDTSNVTEMYGTFDNSKFNQPLNNWDVSNVTTMRKMFYRADLFNQDLNSWDTSNVTDMDTMFFQALNFNGDISSWDVGNVEYMFGLLKETSFTGDITNWNVSNVTDFRHMFEGTSFNRDISVWNVSSAIQMSSMFENAASFDQDLSGWCVPEVWSYPTNWVEGSPMQGRTELFPTWADNSCL